MRAIQTRCLKCGTVFASTGNRVLHCTCCYADENYLKPVITEVAAHLAAERAAHLDSSQTI
jgi:predicted  nucleic acid-binding Zn-ribbon protein